MISIGVTGGYGSGKTFVCSLFAKFGAERVSADEVARDLVRPRRKAWRLIVKSFGRDILNARGEINRKKLAGLVFADADKKKLIRLNNITHPLIKKELRRLLGKAKQKKHGILVVEAPLLFEADMSDWFDGIVMVVCGREKAFARRRKKSGISRKEFLQRHKAQWPLCRKKQKSDFIIDNSGNAAKTRKQAEEIWAYLMGI